MKFKLLLPFLLLTAGCDLLLQLDQTPPTCFIRSPADSAFVSGVVQIEAEAFDSLGIATVDFYVDGVLIATDTSSPATASWNTEPLPAGSWHRLFCIATDLAGNKGSSDTVNVQVFELTGKNIFHGQITLNHNYFYWVEFAADSAATIIGDARAATNGNISRFSILDQTNFSRYRQGQNYTPLYEERNIAQLTVTYPLATAGTFYLVFLNTTGATQTYWARFILKI